MNASALAPSRPIEQQEQQEQKSMMSRTTLSAYSALLGVVVGALLMFCAWGLIHFLV